MRAIDKVHKLLFYLAHKTKFTAGEPVFLKHPNDLSLAFAKSIDEFCAIIKQLEKDGLVDSFRKSPDEFQISLTIQGVDHVSTTQREQSRVVDERIDVEITGSPKGSGAFGRVYPGLQTNLKREVAIKIIEAQAGPDAIAHAQGLAKVNHPNVVTVYDVGRVKHPTTGEIVDCVIMELIDGSSLNKVWTSFSKGDALRLSRQLVDGLRAMHYAGVCHHDLHAGNVLVSGETLKIIDIQYTETARLSRLQSEPRQQLVEEDCNAAARLVRNAIWNVDRDLLTPNAEDRLIAVRSLEELAAILDEFEKPQEPVIESGASRHELFPGLSDMDLKVLQLAGDQLVANDRFSSFISVPQIHDAVGTYSGIASSIRMLSERGFFTPSDQEHPRYLMFTTSGFEQYLSAFRKSYDVEMHKICAEIVRHERTRDIEIVAMTEIPRPIVEHVINVLATKQLVGATRYNSETKVYAVSEELRRKFVGSDFR
jgi:hypothetical protein